MGGVGLIVIGIVVYAFYIGERLTTLDEPLLDAAMEIQLETEAADLWFREFIQGNMVVDIETIWQPLEQSVWYLHSILQSNKISKKFYSPLKDNDTRELIENVQQKLAALKKIIELIALTTEKSGSATELRLGYEKAIKEFLDQVDQLEGRLLFIKAKNIRHFRYLHLILIITSIVLLFSISLAFQFFVGRRKKDYQALNEAKQGLEMENAERVRAETELKKAHQELEERVLRRTSELSLANKKLIAEIAERNRVEKQLQQSKFMLQEVFDGIPDSLMLIDRHMGLKMINKSAAAYYNVEKFQDVTGKRCYQVAGKSTFCKGCRIHEAVMNGEKNSFERQGFMNPERIEQVTIYPLVGNGDSSGDTIVRVIDI